MNPSSDLPGDFVHTAHFLVFNFSIQSLSILPEDTVLIFQPTYIPLFPERILPAFSLRSSLPTLSHWQWQSPYREITPDTYPLDFSGTHPIPVHTSTGLTSGNIHFWKHQIESSKNAKETITQYTDWTKAHDILFPRWN